MVIVLIIALIVLCLILGLACHRLIIQLQRELGSTKSLYKLWYDEMTAKARHQDDLHGVLLVLNDYLGGISQRISYSAKIADAIQTNAPELFKQCDDLAHWLFTNDQFLLKLAAATGLDRDHQRRLDEMNEAGREDVFTRIYGGTPD